jgi:hypothetical protein
MRLVGVCFMSFRLTPLLTADLGFLANFVFLVTFLMLLSPVMAFEAVRFTTPAGYFSSTPLLTVDLGLLPNFLSVHLYTRIGFAFVARLCSLLVFVSCRSVLRPY